MKNETPKITTPVTATDVNGVAPKSDVTLTRHVSIDNSKLEKPS
jgi:hypothetical protein